MPDTLLVDDLSFSYKSWTEREDKLVLSHFSLSMKAGEKVLLLAPFDAGKSTLARILAGLCPKYLEGTLTGTVRVDGIDVEESEPWDLVEHVGYVSQNPREQFIASSVEDELAFPLESLGVGRREMRVRVKRALEKWGLSRFATASEAQLSGGEGKRVLLALTEMVNPSLWILDESFDDLDASWRTLLEETIRESGRSILVLASRHLTQFEHLFDRRLLLGGEEGDDIVHAFSVLSGDDSLEALENREEKSGAVLEARDIEARRRRESDSEKRVFSLSVPSFLLRSGTIVTLSGPNGSGKSTFARLACGLDEAAGGSFLVNGRRADAHTLNRTVGYLFQNPDLQIFLPTVRDELAWSLERDGRYRKAEIEEKVEETASLFGLAVGDTPTTMSYPQRKALQAAVSYLLERPFYILDEIDNALTYAKALNIVKLLHEKGAGILVITHDGAFTRLLPRGGYEIREGRMVPHGD